MKSYAIDPFYAIADINRRAILKLLSKKRLTINSLAENFDMSRPAVSKHVKILFGAGFITVEIIGRERYCRLKQEGFNELHDWMEYYDSFWNSRLDALGQFLSKANNKSRKIKENKKK